MQDLIKKFVLASGRLMIVIFTKFHFQLVKSYFDRQMTVKKATCTLRGVQCEYLKSSSFSWSGMIKTAPTSSTCLIKINSQNASQKL